MWIQSTPSNPIIVRSILLLSSSLCAKYSKWSFFFGFLYQNTVCMSLLCLTHLVHLMLGLIIPIMFGGECKLWGSSLYNFLHGPDTSFLLGPNILFSMLFSNTIICAERPHFIHVENNRQNYSCNSSLKVNLYHLGWKVESLKILNWMAASILIQMLTSKCT
jgi:hypothetical protein